MFETLWVLAGFIGSLLWWRILTSSDTPFQRCPTPRAIFLCAVFSSLGFFVWLMVLIVTIAELIIWYDKRPKKDTWWTRPLCK